MNMRLYGICFKLRGGPDLLDCVQTGSPVPVDVMGQVMEEMGSITQAEMAFAETLDTDWKKAMNEKVPILMGVAQDGGYDITCTIPDELLDAVRLLTGMENEQIVEEYTANYLKEVCGVEADILSVDVDPEVEMAAPIETKPAVGFDLGDLDESPEAPAFEDVSGIDVEKDIPVAGFETPVQRPVQAPAVQEPIPMEEPEPEDYPEEEPAYEDDMGGYEDEGYEEGYPEEEPYEEPVTEEPAEEEPAEEAQPDEDVEQNAMVGIYKEMVTNIKDRKLDERLGLRIGQ